MDYKSTAQWESELLKTQQPSFLKDNPSVCLLGMRVENIQSTLSQQIIALAFLSVKQIILMNWKSPQPNCFNIDIWLKYFIDLLLMEQTATALSQYDHGGDGPWAFIRSYLENKMYK